MNMGNSGSSDICVSRDTAERLLGPSGSSASGGITGRSRDVKRKSRKVTGKSRDVTGKSCVPESGDCNTGNSDLTNAQETCECDLSNNNYSNATHKDDCVNACVSGSDLPQTGACVPINGLDLNNCTLSEEDIQKVVDALLESTNSTAMELDDMPAITKVNNKVKDVHKNLIEILETVQFTAKELDGKDFMQLAEKVKNCQKRGMFPPLMISEIKKLILVHYDKELNKKDFHHVCNELRIFDSNLKVHEASEDCFYPRLPTIIKFLKAKDILSDELNSEYITLMKEEDDIQRKIDEHEDIDILGIVQLVNNLYLSGILSHLILSNFLTLADELKELRLAMNLGIKKLYDMIKKVSKVSQNYHKDCTTEEHNEDEVVQFFINTGQTVGTFLTQMREEDIQTKAKIKNCRSEHYTPFCSRCGWRTSWVKSFKKRGVYVKEELTGITENIWYIPVSK